MPRGLGSGLGIRGGPGGGDHDDGDDGRPGIRQRFSGALRDAREHVRDGRGDLPPAPEAIGAAIGATRGFVRNKVENGLNWILTHRTRTLITVAILAALGSAICALGKATIRRGIPDCVEADGRTPCDRNVAFPGFSGY